MKTVQLRVLILCIGLFMFSCLDSNKKMSNPKLVKENNNLTAKDILGNPNYLAISYGGYRKKSRDSQPSIKELKDDMKILSAMGIKILRTYNVQLKHAPNLLQAISELKIEDSNFEMYVMLGAWIDCLNAWTDHPVNHDIESPNNAGEIERAVALANEYPDIVKIIAVGNEAMVKWAEAYYVQPNVILKWVNHLQKLKKTGQLPKDLWITSSDNFASWGGGGAEYHVQDLEALIESVDYISMHTYPMHDTHYNPFFWGVKESEYDLSKKEKIKNIILRSRDYAISQYDSVVSYVRNLGIKKPIHIGETGWTSYSNELFGYDGTRAADEFKQALYYNHMREWSKNIGVSCFYFEAFNEQWKDAHNPEGSENHFGLFRIKGQAKYVLWDLVDKGVFDGLTRNGNPIIKTRDGDKDKLMQKVLVPRTESEIMSNR
jgi:exo-beta-1,3-glucanase (GH17 family)